MRKLLFILFLILGSSFFTLCLGQYNVLYNFDGASGKFPIGALLPYGNKFYGVTNVGGSFNKGVIFSIDSTGANYTKIFDFNGANGAYPENSLITSGKFLYGMARLGGAHDSGCIFSIDTNGNVYRDLWDFGAKSTNGAFPYGSLLLLGNKFYGTTQFGGMHDSGSIFSIDTNGNGFKIVYSFTTTKGSRPFCALVPSAGYLYGTTVVGGANDEGCIFSIDTNGSGYVKLLDFNWTNGAYPCGSLILSGNVLYGMTGEGGSQGWGCIFSIQTNGTNYNRIFSFNGYNGNSPSGSLILVGTSIYGMTTNGGDSATRSYYGNIFSLKTSGIGFRQLCQFDSVGILGKFPEECTLTSFGRALYGMTTYGGINDSGIIFKIDTDAAASVDNLSPTTSSINAYPNPSHGQFTIKSSAVSGKSSVEVYNVLGEQVYSTAMPQTSRNESGTGSKGALIEIDLSSQPNGIYLYRVIGDSGDLIGEGKLVIQK